MEEERKLLLKRVATVADGPTGDGKKDRYPSQNRLAFAFQEAHKVNSRLQRSGSYNIAHTFIAVEASITQCSDLYEDFEHLHNTPIPLPYAQLVRLIALIFLLELPLSAVADIRQTFGPENVFHFNIYPSARVTAGPAPGFSGGEALDLMEQIGTTELPPGTGFAWRDMAYQMKSSTGAMSTIFGLAVILVYLVLAAQYESWALPISVVLSIPTALLGVVGALMISGLPIDLYVQVGIVLLIGLAAKSSILIVEFAKSKRDEGLSATEAALMAARLRFRAVLMTAFSFILGVIPLLVAEGAGSASRRTMGATVFGGMLAATIISLLVVPVLYSVVQRLADVGRRDQPEKTTPEAK